MNGCGCPFLPPNFLSASGLACLLSFLKREALPNGKYISNGHARLFFLSAIQRPETEPTCASEMCAKGLFTLRDGDRRGRTTTLRWV